MPIIVPIEDNKVGLATATDATFRAPDYSGSGLEALGAGLAQLGGGGQQLASGLEERRRRAAEAIAAAMLDDRHQSNIDDAAVKQAYVDYSDPTHEALHGEDGLFNRQGAGAHAAFPGLVETLVDNHDKALSKLDDVQRAAVAPAMNERLRNDVARAADYVRLQGVTEQKWQSEQLKKTAARDAVNHADDPDLFDHHLATGEKTIRQQAKIDKVGDKLLAKQIADYKSGVHADTIETLTQRDPVRAASWYARNGDTLNRRDKLRVEAKLGAVLAGNQGSSGDERSTQWADAVSEAGSSSPPSSATVDIASVPQTQTNPQFTSSNAVNGSPSPSWSSSDVSSSSLALNAPIIDVESFDGPRADGFSLQPAGQAITFDQHGRPTRGDNGDSVSQAMYDAFADAGDAARQNLSDLANRITGWRDAKKGWDLLWQDGKTQISSDYVLAHPREFPGKVLTYSVGFNPAPGVLDAGRFATDQLSGRYVTFALASQKFPNRRDIGRMIALARTLKTGVAAMGQFENVGLFSAHGVTASFGMNGVSFSRSYSYDPGRHSLTYSGISSSLGIPNVRGIPSPTAQRSYTVLYDVRRK